MELIARAEFAVVALLSFLHTARFGVVQSRCPDPRAHDKHDVRGVLVPLPVGLRSLIDGMGAIGIVRRSGMWSVAAMAAYYRSAEVDWTAVDLAEPFLWYDYLRAEVIGLPEKKHSYTVRQRVASPSGIPSSSDKSRKRKESGGVPSSDKTTRAVEYEQVRVERLFPAVPVPDVPFRPFSYFETTYPDSVNKDPRQPADIPTPAPVSYVEPYDGGEDPYGGEDTHRETASPDPEYLDYRREEVAIMTNVDGICRRRGVSCPWRLSDLAHEYPGLREAAALLEPLRHYYRVGGERWDNSNVAGQAVMMANAVIDDHDRSVRERETLLRNLDAAEGREVAANTRAKEFSDRLAKAEAEVETVSTKLAEVDTVGQASSARVEMLEDEVEDYRVRLDEQAQVVEQAVSAAVQDQRELAITERRALDIEISVLKSEQDQTRTACSIMRAESDQLTKRAEAAEAKLVDSAARTAEFSRSMRGIRKPFADSMLLFQRTTDKLFDSVDGYCADVALAGAVAPEQCAPDATLSSPDPESAPAPPPSVDAEVPVEADQTGQTADTDSVS